jgi:hypothetical protein
MTKEQIIEVMNSLGEDVTYWDYDNVLHVTLEDFAGFDENWNEVDRDYDNPEAVNDFLIMLEDSCHVYDNDGLYELYRFDDFDVKLGCASFDI